MNLQALNLEDMQLQLAQSASSLSAAYLNSILPGLAQHYGFDQDELLTSSGLNQADLQDPEFMVPFASVAALFLLVFQKAADPGLGLVIGSLVQPRSYQVLGYAVMSSASLGEAVDRLIRYEKLVGKLGHTEIQLHESVCRLRWHCPFQGAWTRFLKEAAIAGWVTYGRSLLPQETALQRVCFDHPAVIPESRYQDLFHCPVELSATWCGVEFEIALLDQPLNYSDPGLKGLMDSRAQELLRDFEQKANLANEVRAVVANLLPGGEPTLEVVAARMDLTPRALQNRLRQSDETFKEIVDRVRKDVVVGYLRDESLSLLDLAFLLGFAEQSSFSRAFKRWYGMSPQQYRRHLGLL